MLLLFVVRNLTQDLAKENDLPAYRSMIEGIYTRLYFDTERVRYNFKVLSLFLFADECYREENKASSR